MFRAGIALAAALSLCVQEEMEANPEFAAWEKQKPGAWVKWSVETSGATKLASELTVKLRERTAEKAILEEKTVLSSGGDPHVATRVVPAKLRKGATADGDKYTVQKEGEETLTIRGKDMKCAVTELRLTDRPGRTVKIWRSDQVVGGIARTVTQHDEAAKVALTMTAIDWKAAD